MERYLQLLKPLRVLADNWGIDLIQELSEYADDVTQTQVQDKDVNFAQAALLIQNSANIYSKKVQYLYTLTQEAHVSFFGGKGGAVEEIEDEQQDGEIGDKENTKKSKRRDGVLSFECLDRTLNKKDFRMASQQQALLLNKVTQQIRQSSFEIKNAEGESIGSKADFEMNEANVDVLGMFWCNVLQPATIEDIIPDTSFAFDPQVLDSLDSFGQSTTLAPSFTLPECQPEVEQPLYQQVSESSDAQDDDTHRELQPHVEYNKQVRTVTVSKMVTVEVPPPKKQGQNQDFFWDMVDPHEVVGAAKPFKKGAVTKAYKTVEKVIKASLSNSKELPALRDFIKNQETAEIKQKLPRDTFFYDIDPQFEYMYLNEKNRRQALLKPIPEKFYQEIEVIEEVEEIIEMPQQQQTFDHVVEQDEDTIEEQPFIEPLLKQSQASSQGSTLVETQTFEDLCKLRIRNYMERANEFERKVESNLAKNVRSWESRLQPLLEEQYIRGVFDVDVVRDQVLDAIIDVSQTDPIPFWKAVKDVPHWNVSRYFISALHLANEERVVIKKSSDGLMIVQVQANDGSMAHSRLKK